jgi:hypothetical protein
MNKHLSVQEFVHENCMAVYVVGRRGYHGGGVQLMGVFTVVRTNGIYDVI